MFSETTNGVLFDMKWDFASGVKCSPVCNNVAAMPDIAVAKAILLFNLMKSKMTLMI